MDPYKYMQRMRLNIHPIEIICQEEDVYEFSLALDNQNILELGCGDASLTRLIATLGKGRKVTATEEDAIKYRKNLLKNNLPQVNFIHAGAEDIPLPDESFDTILMFKTLHHVPLTLMSKAMEEIHRVLKPNGIAYISEPIFYGEFNEILKLIHNAEPHRQAAFEVLQQAVEKNQFSLVTELFFNVPLQFKNFSHCMDHILLQTPRPVQISDELYQTIKKQFNFFFAKNNGKFLNPTRVDILEKKGHHLSTLDHLMR